MTEPLILRPATPADVPACAAILNRWIDQTPWMPRRRSPAEIEARYRELVIPGRTVLIAAQGDRVQGFLAVDEAQGEITSFYAATPGAGVGAALITAAKQTREALHLWTFQANHGARRFYRREGFSEVDRTDGENDENLPDICFRWIRGAEAAA